MGFPARWATAPGGTGDLDSETSGTTVGGTALSTSGIAADTLSCLFTVDAETDTITITGKFQVSDDNSTWYDLAGDAQNPANVILATGTAGADTPVSRVLPVPSSVLGWKYVRPAVVVGVTTGEAVDTYEMTFHFRRFNGFS